MKITNEIRLAAFEPWSGAIETKKSLTLEELEQLEFMLEDCYPDGIDETQLNDILRFEQDWIAEMLGFTDWENLLSHR